MKLIDHLDNETLSKLNVKYRPKKERKRYKEELTETEIKELMGIYRDTYKKVNGKWRRVK